MGRSVWSILEFKRLVINSYSHLVINWIRIKSTFWFLWPLCNLLYVIITILIIMKILIIILNNTGCMTAEVRTFLFIGKGRYTQKTPSAVTQRTQGYTSPGRAPQVQASSVRRLLLPLPLLRYVNTLWHNVYFPPPLPRNFMNLCRTARQPPREGSKKLFECLKERKCLLVKGLRPLQQEHAVTLCLCLFVHLFSLRFFFF